MTEKHYEFLFNLIYNVTSFVFYNLLELTHVFILFFQRDSRTTKKKQDREKERKYIYVKKKQKKTKKKHEFV